MKQKDVKVGETYLFTKTDIPHRKHLEGTLFTVTQKIQGKKKWRTDGFGFPMLCKTPPKYADGKGNYAGAANLSPIN